MRMAGLSSRILLLALAAISASAPARAPTGLAQDGARSQVIAFDDTEGYFEFTAQGNRGSHFTVRAEFNGFYVVPQLAATRLKQAYGSLAPSDLPDLYEIIPRELKITGDINGTYQHEVTHNGFTQRQTVQHKLDRQFTVISPPFPAGEQPIEALLHWSGLVLDAQPRHDPDYQCRILIRDATPVGGKATVEASLHLGLKGTYQETHENNIPGSNSPRTVVQDGKYSLRFSALEKNRPRALVNTRSWPSVEFATIPFDVIEPISLDDFRIVTARSMRVAHSGQPTTYGALLSDTTYTMKASLRIGATTPYAYLEPVAANEKWWRPTPAADREYRIVIEDENLQNVEALRVTLSDTSAHPGIATNAGNHVRSHACAECRAGRTTTGWRWSGPFNDSHGNPVTISRSYQHYNKCPIDSMPDAYFVKAGNDGWTFPADAEAQSAALKDVVAQAMTFETAVLPETRFRVHVMDGAASTRLSAEVKIAGVWFPVTARGATSERNGAYLMVPLDANQNGLQDIWETGYQSHDPDADTEAEPAGASSGDGLTVFEEYRGVYARGSHRPLWPDTRELFVYDYTGLLEQGLNAAAALQRRTVELIRLSGNEFMDDVVNYLDGSPHRAGRQSLVVVMSVSQTPGVVLDFAAGRAAHLGPPQPGANTVIIKYVPADTSGLGSLLAHEMGHLMNMPHHGAGEGLRDVGGELKWVACLHGQHSGDTTCLMRYFAADYVFPTGNPVPNPLNRDPLGSGQITPFSANESAAHYCTTRAGASECQEAAVGAGSCLSKLKVRSY